MIGTSTLDYVRIRTSIFLLSSIVPVSLIYTANLLLHRPLPFPEPPPFLHRWMLAEAAFYLLVYLPRRAYLQAAAVHPPLLTQDERRALFRRCHANITDPEAYLRKWFLDADPSEIRRDNYTEFLQWAFFNGVQSGEHREELDEYIDATETLLGRRLEPGRGAARCLRLTLDPVDMLHRSLLWYAVVFIVDAGVCLYFFLQGFQFRRVPYPKHLLLFPPRPSTISLTRPSPSRSLSYWYRPHTSKTRLPLLFIHGIGIGIYPYAKYLADVAAAQEDGVGIIAIEIMEISSRLTSEALRREDMCAEMGRIVDAHGWDKFVVVSHSYGSLVVGHLLRDPRLSHRIGPIIFVDPITFLLHLPDVAYNFVYRKPIRANEHQLSYFASKDMGVAHTLFRRFFWADNIMWKDDLVGRDATLVLAGQDLIVNTPTVARYITGNSDLSSLMTEDIGVWKGDGIELVWLRDLDHAQAFDDPQSRKVLVERTLRASQTGSA